MVTVHLRCRPCGPDRERTGGYPQAGGSGIERNSERTNRSTIQYPKSLSRERKGQDESDLWKAESSGIGETSGRLVSICECNIHSDTDHHAEHHDFHGGVFSYADCSGSPISSDSTPDPGKSWQQSLLVRPGATRIVRARR